MYCGEGEGWDPLGLREAELATTEGDTESPSRGEFPLKADATQQSTNLLPPTLFSDGHQHYSRNIGQICS